MNRNNKPRYQHYLPKTYLRGFRASEKEDNCYVFDVNKDENDFINERLTPKSTKKNFKNIFTEQHRHTLNIDNEKDFMIEDFYCKMESLYPEFISIVHAYTFENNNVNGKLYSGIYNLSEPEISKEIKVMITFLIYRLKCFDKEMERKKSFSSSILMREINQAIGMTAMALDVPKAEIINTSDWLDFSLDMSSIGFLLNYADSKYVSEIKIAYDKVYRFIFQWMHQLAHKKCFIPFIFLAPKGHPFISSDAPFIIEADNHNEKIVFPITKGSAILINFNIENLTKQNHAKLVLKINSKIAKNAKEAIISHDFDYLKKYIKIWSR
ncbi:DUF4238 domain-containing protein [Aeromonas veronii]|uniref:DUF4238 domain-containing protein n=1 Tax=Aeromonas veronii TaxID=654 RepID=UPI0015E732B1|nr:DUF4238 domain-containing protein [Aeromonas veronii]MBA2073911.1 hypothetical protein [Aeromonas veronii]